MRMSTAAVSLWLWPDEFPGYSLEVSLSDKSL